MTDEDMEQLFDPPQYYWGHEGGWYDLLRDSPYSEPLRDDAKQIIVERCNTWLKEQNIRRWRVVTVEVVDNAYRWTLEFFNDTVTYLPGFCFLYAEPH